MTLSIQNNLSKRNENKSYDGDSPKLILSATFFFICSKAFAPFTVASHCLRTLQRLRCRFGESIVFRFCLSATDFVCVPCIAPTVSHYYSTETKNRNVTWKTIEFFFFYKMNIIIITEFLSQTLPFRSLLLKYTRIATDTSAISRSK